MKKYRVLIVGSGGQGALADAPGSGNEHKIISFAHALKEHPGFELFGFVDKEYGKAEKAADIWGCHAFAKESLRYTFKFSDDIDVVVVTTPDDTHYEILKYLYQFPTLKLVICEKPLCTNLEQAREIVDLYKNRSFPRSLPLMVNYTRRFLPFYRDLKAKHEDKLLYASAVFNRGFLHSGSHAVDLFEWFGFSDYYLKMIDYPDDKRFWKVEMMFKDYCGFKEERYEGDPVWDYYDESHKHIVENAYNFLEGKEPLFCTGEDALKTLEKTFALMQESMRKDYNFGFVKLGMPFL